MDKKSKEDGCGCFILLFAMLAGLSIGSYVSSVSQEEALNATSTEDIEKALLKRYEKDNDAADRRREMKRKLFKVDDKKESDNGKAK